MDIDRTAGWRERALEQLVRYEALFKLLDDIHQTEEIEEIARQAVKHWKYFANVVCWRLVLPDDDGFWIIDGFRGEAHVSQALVLQDWDARHLSAGLPRQARLDEELHCSPPEHLAGKSITEIQVLPFVRMGQCIGLLSAAARHKPFNELDLRFTRLFGSHFCDRVSNILLRRKAMQTLFDRATRDALTGLLNRGTVIEQLDKRLGESQARGEPLSIILADIDFFKVINDTHGHLAGDIVLREVSRLLRAHTLSGDALGRYGGEEFLFVLWPCGSNEIERAAERLRRVIAETPIAVGDGHSEALEVTLSMGTASTSGREAVRLEALLKRADDALYEAKRSGRNRVKLG